MAVLNIIVKNLKIYIKNRRHIKKDDVSKTLFEYWNFNYVGSAFNIVSIIFKCDNFEEIVE